MARPDTKAKGSLKARNTAARLAAVQALYQMAGNAQNAPGVIREYIDFRFGLPFDGNEMVTPEHALFSRIVSGVEERRSDLAGMVSATLGDRSVERLLDCILMCGAYELLAQGEVDAPIVISDYLHVADAFYGQGEKKLVNAVLDRIAANVRDG